MLYLCSMEIFYTYEIDGTSALLDAEESTHCIKVLRHRAGDEITVVDGIGNMYRCRLTDDSTKGAAAEKATELGVDVISPVIGERSERKVFKTERTRKIVLSAMKQSLKAKLPVVEEPASVRDFILAHREDAGIRMICYCFDGETVRRSIKDVMQGASEDSEITVLIGPEGDFSPGEASLAVKCGFIPVHLGPSRLRTETAAVTAVTACYLHFLEKSAAK